MGQGALASSTTLFVFFVVALFPLRCSQRIEWGIKRLRNMSDPARLGDDRHLESQTISRRQRSRSSRHRDADVFAPSQLDLPRVQAPKIAKIV